MHSHFPPSHGKKVRSAHKMCVGSQVCIKSHQFLLCQHRVVAPVQIINVNIVNWSNFLALWHLNRIAALCEPFVQILKLCRVSRWLGEGSHSAVKFYDPTKSSFYVVLVTRIESQFASVGIEERRTQTATIQMNEEMQSNHLYSVLKFSISRPN